MLEPKLMEVFEKYCNELEEQNKKLVEEVVALRERNDYLEKRNIGGDGRVCIGFQYSVEEETDYHRTYSAKSLRLLQYGRKVVAVQNS